MKGGHYGVFRTICCFDKADPGEIARVKDLQSEILTILLDLGFVPYKAPGWVVEELERRGHPGYFELLRRVKRALDPAGTMNPGRWDL
jgi:FAD/FMN-containing dehydrogenase